MYGVTEHQLQTERDASRAAADTAGQVGKQWMVCVHLDAGLVELSSQALSGYGIAQKQLW